MNLKRYLINRRLKATMKPDEEYRTRRLAQFSKERRERYWRNVQSVYEEHDYKNVMEMLHAVQWCLR